MVYDAGAHARISRLEDRLASVEAWREPIGALILTIFDEAQPEWQLERAKAEVIELSRVLNAQPSTNLDPPKES